MQIKKWKFVHRMERIISVWTNWNIRDQLWRWSTLTSLVISIGLTIWQNFVPSTALLYPAYKNNNQIHDGLGQICATGMYCFIEHVKFPKFQTTIFVKWKAPLVFAQKPYPGCHRFIALGSLQFCFTCSLPALIIWGILVTCCFNITTHHRSTFISIPIMPPSTMDYCNTWNNKQSISLTLVMSKVLDCKVKILCRFYFEGPTRNIVVLQFSH